MNIKLICLSLLSLNHKDLYFFMNNYKIEYNILNKEIYNNIDLYSIRSSKTIYFNYYKNNKIPITSYYKFT